jgi:hypothetical protein
MKSRHLLQRSRSVAEPMSNSVSEGLDCSKMSLGSASVCRGFAPSMRGSRHWTLNCVTCLI